MKKAVLIIILTIVTGQAFAQRYCDLKVKLTSPMNGDTILTGSSFLISARFINQGADTFKTTDTLQFSLTFNGSPILFQVDSVTSHPYLLLSGQQIASGDSAGLNFHFTIDTGWQTGNTTFCVSGFPRNANNTITDTNLSDNTSCANLVISTPLGVEQVYGTDGGINVYPNPANTVLNFEFPYSASEKTDIEIWDASGRLIIADKKEQVGNGNNITKVNTGDLPAGFYIYRITIGEKIQNGKLQIQH